MRFKAVFTHNPQDFFNGSEPIELCETIEFEINKEPLDEVFADIIYEVSDGYSVIISKTEDDP